MSITETAQTHAAYNVAYIFLGLYAIIAIIIIGEYVRCKTYLHWLSKHSDENETVPGTVAVIYTMPTKTRLTVRYTTLKGLIIYKDLSRDVPGHVVWDLKKGDDVQVTYRRSRPNLAYLEPYGDQKFRGVKRGLYVVPILFVFATIIAGSFLTTILKA